MNSFFASVEQQLESSIRGRPVAITAMEDEKGCCVAAVLDRYAELERIRSVDEFQIVLSGDATELDGAWGLVARLKGAVAAEVGECLRFSAGIGPNHLLAKIAGKLEKPDGCQHLGLDNMPDRLAHLALDDLPVKQQRRENNALRRYQVLE